MGRSYASARHPIGILYSAHDDIFVVHFQVTADSCGRKSKQAMLPLIRLFLTSVPECMELKTIERVQYVKLKKTSPDINQVKKMLEDLVTKTKNKI